MPARQVHLRGQDLRPAATGNGTPHGARRPSAEGHTEETESEETKSEEALTADNLRRRRHRQKVAATRSDVKTGTCRLCLEHGNLRGSHLMPRFVARWIRRTSATGRLRNAARPNAALKDFGTRPFLCPRCEGRLERLETAFSRDVFHPVWNSDHPVVHVNRDVMGFAVSLSWRTLAATLEDAADGIPLTARVHHELWRRLLIGAIDDGGEHHMYMLRCVPYDAFGLSDPDVEALNWYFYRAVDATVVTSNSLQFVYAKLPGLAFLSALSGPLAMRGTRLVPGALLNLNQGAIDASLRKLIFRRGIEGFRRVSQMSEVQQAATATRYMQAGPSWEHSLGPQILAAMNRFRGPR